MNSGVPNKTSTSRWDWQLLAIVILSSAALMVMNYYTVKLLSGARAYINGESYYSKGQKDASRNLVMYLDTGEEKYWQDFQEQISIPLGDQKARKALLQEDENTAREGFIQGRNHPEDIDEMIWLFTSFGELRFMKEPIRIWTEADSIINEQVKLGEYINKRIEAGALTEEDKDLLRRRINFQSSALTVQERAFLNSLGSTSRLINQWLLIGNTILIILILLTASLFSMRFYRKLRKSEAALRERNEELRNTNTELDRFVYSVSHDLRAPITSMKGLIYVARDEKDDSARSEYFDLMEQSLEQQDRFIRSIISFARNKRGSLEPQQVDLEKLVDETIDQLVYMEELGKIEIGKALEVSEFMTDAVRLRIVLSNLLSNAIKYYDSSKEKPRVDIRSSLNQEGSLVLEVADNGIGMAEEVQNKIFEMFYMSRESATGSGIGLYIVRETVSKLGGKVKVESAPGEGSRFRITIPRADEIPGNRR